ncbi:MAG: YraN family protein [Candidatus Omnitrophica bacterium]|nr:YraN family protein [Candidatus Omnitrophota bacterium]
MDNKTLGKTGEDLAVRFLKRKGYTIIYRNWRCLLGEIDIVAREKDFIVFIEIKARRSLSFGPGYLAVNHRKQSKLIKLGQAYLKRYGLTESPCRIDVVSIDMPESGADFEIELIKDAFWENRT